MEIFACVSKISSSSQNPIPITINKYLPSINFHLVLIIKAENYIQILVDTSDAINTGNKDCHL